MSRMRRAERSLSSGSSAAWPRSTFERSTPLLAQTKPWLVSVMTRSPRRRSTRTASCLDHGLVGERVVGVDGHEATLGLRDDLLRHDEHVAVEQRAVRRSGAGVGDELAELVARADLAHPLDAPQR